MPTWRVIRDYGSNRGLLIYTTDFLHSESPMQKPTIQDDARNTRGFLTLPPALARARLRAESGFYPEPLRLGAGGVDAAPSDVQPGPQPGKGPR
jgi:hypothetical protein